MNRRKRSVLESVSQGHGRIAQPRAVRRSKSLVHQVTRSVTAGNDQHRIYHLPSPESDTPFMLNSKRKCLHDDDESIRDQSYWKRVALNDRESPARTVEALTQDGKHDPIAYWATHKSWPPNFVDQDPKMSGPLAKKRLRSTSYTQSVKDGENPPAHSRRHEERMEEAGLVMADNPAGINEACRTLCEDLLRSEPSIIQSTFPEKERFAKVLDRVRYRNEARIVRDVTPVLVPSAELLHIDGFPGLEHATEAVDALWEGIATLCGPTPKPDLVIGISPSAFTNEEKENLKMHHTSHCPNRFPESMYFPFLVCEVKCSDKSIREAERQAMHSASIAANAIIQLYKKVSRAHELNRKLLTISVAHDNSTVMVFGHFAYIMDDRVTFFRHRIYENNFGASLAYAIAATHDTDEWCRAYKVAMGIYEHLFPKHLSRIKSAVVQLHDQALNSFTSQLGVDSFEEGTGSQDLGTNVSSQENAIFKKPSHPASIRLQQENDKLLLLLQQQQEQQKQQQEQQKQQQEQQKQQQEQQKRQMEMMERQIAQQKEEHKQQMTQLKDIIELLKQSRTT
ncbi:hypothetical protein M433DRAFT_134797 [Acidomyces richmondensis BFW]|nr:MAG: hypothetical protein FE78DRAFT_99711 [Acidomyces sp. 'richmondensis']KYG45343.1 hypothetical protein M433DRAFT_134797 [Acidomyces richmondensis BFW]